MKKSREGSYYTDFPQQARATMACIALYCEGAIYHERLAYTPSGRSQIALKNRGDLPRQFRREGALVTDALGRKYRIHWSYDREDAVTSWHCSLARVGGAS